ncbi:MAG: universal stress protein [Gaiellales bacterium]|jgi:nucleotide-binding universal stress UspA family protein
MSTSIILALDGSEGSERAIPVAEQYARRDGARLVVAHARTHAVETATEDTLHARVEQISQSGIEASMVIRDTLFGDEAQTIADIAKDAGAGLIVIASRGRGPFKGAVLGSTTQRLLPLAGCPVLVVPGGYTGEGLVTADTAVAEA